MRMREVEGCASVRAVLRGIEVCAETALTLPPAKTLRAQESLVRLRPGDFAHSAQGDSGDPGKAQTLVFAHPRFATEAEHVDRPLVVLEGEITPLGALLSLKQAYVDICDSLGTMRAHFLTADSLSQSYTASFPRVLSLGELLFAAESADRVAWVGPDATPSQRSAVDFANKVFTVSPYSFFLQYVARITGLSADDFMLIALAGFLSTMWFGLVMSSLYMSKLIAYA